MMEAWKGSLMSAMLVMPDVSSGLLGWPLHDGRKNASESRLMKLPGASSMMP